MVKHDIVVSGVQFSGGPPLNKPAVSADESGGFSRRVPSRLERDAVRQGRSRSRAPSSWRANASGRPGTLYQPVARVIHVAMAQLACESVGYPRLDPKRVLSAGLVIRRVPRTDGNSELSKSPDSAWPWMKDRR